MSKSSSQQVLSSGLKLFGSQLIQNIFLLGFGVYFAHVLSKEEMAVVSVYFLLTTLTPTISSLGLIDLLLRRLPELLSSKGKKEAGSLVKTIFVIQLSVSFLVSALIVFFAEGISMSFLKTDRFAMHIQIIGMGAFIQSMISFFDAVIRSIQLFGKLAKAKIVANVVSRIFALAFFLYLGLNGYLWGLLLGGLLNLIMLVYYTREIVFIKSERIEEYKSLVSFSFPYYMSNISRYCLMNIDKYVIGLFLTPAHLATYFIASKLAEYLKQIIDALVNPIFPKIAEFKAENKERVENAFFKTFRYMTLLFIPLSMGGAILSYSLLYLYGGIKYTDGTLILIILFISMIGYGYSGLFGMNIHIMGKPLEKFKKEFYGGALSLIFSFLFVYLLKDTGVALARLCAYWGSMLVGHFLLRKIMHLRYDFSMVKQSLFASTMMVLLIGIPQIIYYELRIVPVQTILGVIVYYLIMMPRLQPNDKELIGSFLPMKLKWIMRG